MTISDMLNHATFGEIVALAAVPVLLGLIYLTIRWMIRER